MGGWVSGIRWLFGRFGKPPGGAVAAPPKVCTAVRFAYTLRATVNVPYTLRATAKFGGGVLDVVH